MKHTTIKKETNYLLCVIIVSIFFKKFKILQKLPIQKEQNHI